MSLHRLKALSIPHLSPGVHNDGGGLHLKITSPNYGSWTMRYSLAGKRREAGLGSYPDVSLAEARATATQYRQRVREGLDPLAERRRQTHATVNAKTFRDAAEAFLEVYAVGKKPATVMAIRSLFILHIYRGPGGTYADGLASIPVAEVDINHVADVLRPKWRTTTMSNRIRWCIESTLDYAIAYGWRTLDNPATLKRIAKVLGARKTDHQHRPTVHYSRIFEFMSKLDGLLYKRQYRPEHKAVVSIDRPALGALCLKLLALTIVRPHNAMQARWQDFDLKNRLWTIPGERMKGRGGKTPDHSVPLSEQALALLEMIPRAEGQIYVFPNRNRTTPLTSNSAIQTGRSEAHIDSNLLGRALDWTGFAHLTPIDPPFRRRDGHIARRRTSDMSPHGLRACFNTWAHEQTTFRDEVIEMCLSHAIGLPVSRGAYNRAIYLEERTKLMQAWADYCYTEPSELPKNVVTLKTQRKAS